MIKCVISNLMIVLPGSGTALYSSYALSNEWNIICSTCLFQAVLQPESVHVSPGMRISNTVTSLHSSVILGPVSLVSCHTLFDSVGRVEGRTGQEAPELQRPI